MQPTATRPSIPKKTGPNLTDITEVGRKVVKYSAILMVSYMILSVVFRAAVAYYRYLNPPPPPPPTMGFGYLPPIDLPFDLSQDYPEEMTILIPRERLNHFGDRMAVYLMPKPAPSLLADERARGIARSLDFRGEPEILALNRYRWYKHEPIEYVFELDLVSFNFFLRSDYQTRPELLVARTVPNEDQAIRAVKNYLSRINSLPQDIATSSGEVRYLRSFVGELQEAVSLSDATLLQVNLNRVPLEEMYPVYNPLANRAVVSAILTNALGGSAIVDLKYDVFDVNYEAVETYPIKNVAIAIEELEAGKAYIASSEYLEEVIVRDVIMGYFDDYEHQSYLQPIYVFKGDDGFVAYVSAIHEGVVDQ